jgi:exodeoxyribonuclease V alpha subunit
MSSLRERDPYDVRLARQAPGLLRAFNDAGVISAADVQVARRLAALGDVDEPSVLLAFALAVRGPRLGHVLVDLAAIRETVTVDTEEPVDTEALPWPEPVAWCERVAACAIVGTVDDDVAAALPLRLVGSTLYLDRSWREEVQVADALLARDRGPVDPVDLDRLAEGLRRLCPAPGDARRRMAVATAVLRRLTVVAGGPGTGKTSAVACIYALLVEQATAAGAPAPLIALAAPTGKAAARLAEAVHEQAERLTTGPDVRQELRGATASTVHRLLEGRPDSRSRFRHDRTNRLPHDVVIVDEASMLSLTLMARLLEAVPPEARLILVGDPDQLSSVEAGAVLGDVVGPAAGAPRLGSAARALLAQVTGDVPDGDGREGSGFGDGVVVLDRGYRFAGGIADLAAAVRGGDPDAVVRALAAGTDDVVWIAEEATDAVVGDTLEPVRRDAVRSGRAVIAAARAGDAAAALGALGDFRLLCGHRRGPYGVSQWTPRIEEWLAAELGELGGQGLDYPGRPLLITANDYDLDLFNGDTGVVIAGARGGLDAAFQRRGELFEVRPSRLGAVDTVYAMTVHKSQGSQFGTVVVIVPPADSRLLTREVLYTAVTRARTRLIVVASEAAVRTATANPAVRATGLADRLWGGA